MGRVYITGLGVISSLGFGREDFWRSVIAGKTGFNPIERFKTADMERSIAGEVKGFLARDFMTAAEARRMGRCSAYAVAAARMAVDEAGLADGQIAGDRTAVVIGTTMGEADVIAELENAWIHNGVAAVDASQLPLYGTTLLPLHVARAFGARCLLPTLPPACAPATPALRPPHVSRHSPAAPPTQGRIFSNKVTESSIPSFSISRLIITKIASAMLTHPATSRNFRHPSIH